MNEDVFHLGVKALIINENRQILLLQVNPEKLIKKAGYNGEVYWDFPGGRTQRDSTIEDTLLREVNEETGIKTLLKYTKFDVVLSNIRIPVGEGSVGLILAIFKCEVRNGVKISLSEEHSKYEWVLPSKAVELLSYKYPKEFTDNIKTL